MNISPVYFNMGRWALAYGGQGVQFTDAVVDGYVARIQANALGGVPSVARRRASDASDNLN